MKLRQFIAPVVTAGIVLAPVAHAADFDYSFLEVGYVNTSLELGSIDIDGDGFGLDGSFALSDSFNVVGEWSTQEFDGNVDVTIAAAGVGWHMPVSQEMDFVSELRFLSTEADSGIVSVEEDGFGVGLGLRGLLQQSVEWEAGVEYTDVGDSNTAFFAEGRYRFTSIVSAGGGFTVDSDGSSWQIGVRADL